MPTLVAQWKAAKQRYTRATQEAKPPASDVLPASGIEPALRLVDHDWLNSARLKLARERLKPIQDAYEKVLKVAARDAKDNKKKVALGELLAFLDSAEKAIERQLELHAALQKARERVEAHRRRMVEVRAAYIADPDLMPLARQFSNDRDFQRMLTAGAAKILCLEVTGFLFAALEGRMAPNDIYDQFVALNAKKGCINIGSTTRARFEDLRENGGLTHDGMLDLWRKDSYFNVTRQVLSQAAGIAVAQRRLPRWAQWSMQQSSSYKKDKAQDELLQRAVADLERKLRTR